MHLRQLCSNSLRFTIKKYSTNFVKTNLNSIICQQIFASGPINIHDYMNLALHHPIYGYYQKKDVIGDKGDFITSPEISQIFGEIFGVWLVNEWKKFGKGDVFDIVEFGPGCATLLSSILRVISKFPDARSSVKNLRLIERSNNFKQIQEETLIPQLESLKLPLNVSWHACLEEIPLGIPTYFIANEFLDALPIHRFQKVGEKWSEVFVNVDETDEKELVFVNARSPTMASSVYLKLAGDLERRNCVEICPKAGVLMQEMSKRISTDGGAALIVDYGHCGNLGDTLRAFKNHKPHHPLKDPGFADITADVDFSFLFRSVEAINLPVVVHGPVSQAYFLIHMGFLARLKVLVDKTPLETDKKNLIAAAEMLLRSNQMGERFKFMAITPKNITNSKYIPSGFYPIWTEGVT